jgi:hypothetical protein
VWEEDTRLAEGGQVPLCEGREAREPALSCVGIAPIQSPLSLSSPSFCPVPSFLCL